MAESEPGASPPESVTPVSSSERNAPPRAAEESATRAPSAERAAVGPALGNPATFPLGFAFLVAATLVAGALLLFPARYATNDDLFAVSSLRAGYDSVFLSHLLNRALIALYRLVPGLPWYSGLLALATATGLALLFACVARHLRSRLLVVVSAVPLMLIGLRATTFLTFSSAMMLLELGAFAMLLELTLHDESPTRGQLTLVALALVAAYALRWRLFLVLLPFGAPVLFWVRRRTLRAMIVLGLVVLSLVVVDRSLARLGQAEGFSHYVAHNFSRSRFHDTDGGSVFGPSTYRAAKRVGWEREDFHIYQIWITLDTARFDMERIDRFVRMNLAAAPRVALERSLSRVVHSLGRYLELWLLLVLTLVTLIISRWRALRGLRRRDALATLVSLTIVFGVTLGLMALRFPARVALPTMAFLLVAAFCFAHQPAGSVAGVTGPVGLTRTVGAIVLLALVFGPAFLEAEGLQAELGESAQRKAEIARCFARLDAAQPKRELLFSLRPDAVGGLGAELSSPLAELADFPARDAFDFRFQPHSPRYRDALRRGGWRDGLALLRWTIDRPGAVFALYDDGSDWLLPLWRAYFRRRVGRRVRFEPLVDCRQAGKGVVFYRLRAAIEQRGPK